MVGTPDVFWVELDTFSYGLRNIQNFIKKEHNVLNCNANKIFKARVQKLATSKDS